MGKTKGRIGIFTGYYLPHLGGVERYVDKISDALVKLGYDIVIVTSNHGRLAEYEQIDGKAIYRLPIRNIAKNRYPIPKLSRSYRDLIARIEAENIDYFLLNTRFHLTSLIGARMGRRLERPVMLVEHGTDHFTINNRVLDFLGGIYEHILTHTIKKYVDRYYGVSKNCNLWLRHFSISASGVLYNAINPSDGRNIKDFYTKTYPKKQVVISYAGRLIREKGIINLLDAFMIVKNEHKTIDLKMVVAGDGELLDIIKRDYDDKAIDMVGRLDFEHVMSLYKRSDIFVYPSLYPEGLPTSILEAGLMECAVIATPRGGTEEVIIDEHHGIIVDGSTESLRIALERLVLDESLRHSLAKTIKSKVEKSFNWDTVAKSLDVEINSFDME